MDIHKLISDDNVPILDVHNFVQHFSHSSSPLHNNNNTTTIGPDISSKAVGKNKSIKEDASQKRMKISKHAWNRIKVEHVNEIPLGVEGVHVYFLRVPENNSGDRETKRKTKALLYDGRKWQTPYNCKTRSFPGKRTQTRCLGGAICTNRNCSYISESGGHPNTTHFKIVKKNTKEQIIDRICLKCQNPARSVTCPNVRKIFEWISDVELRVKYTGLHDKCCVSKETKPHLGWKDRLDVKKQQFIDFEVPDLKVNVRNHS